MVRIPSEYQEVEYIKSTGTQWIDTGVIPTANTISKIKFINHERTGNVIYGHQQDAQDSHDYRMFITGNDSIFWDIVYRRINKQVPSSMALGMICELELGNFYIKDLSNNEIIQSADPVSQSEFVYDYTITLNNYRNGIFSKNSWYYVKIYDDDTIIRNFIPCYHKSSGEIGMYDTVSKQFYTNSGTGTFLKGNDVTYDNINLLESRRRILLNTPHIETISDTIASFETDVATKIKGCKIHFTPIQEGEGDPSPENVRPIHGWDGIEITACGKNLAEKIYGLDSNGGDALSTKIVERGGDGIVSSLIPVRSGCTYKMSCTGRTASARHFWFDDYPLNNPKPISIGGTYSISESYSAPENAKWLFVVWTRQENVNTCGDVQIELGSTATSYEPYRSITLTIPFPQTIYGGYVDLVKGEVVEEWTKLTFDGQDSKINRGPYYYQNLDVFGAAMVYACPYAENVGDNVLCDKLKTYGEYMSSDYLPYLFAGPTKRLYLCVVCGKMSEHPEITTDQQRIDFTNNWLKDNPIDVCYPIETPITYQIDPQTLKALRGMNNIWSDANGNIEVSFYTH